MDVLTVFRCKACNGVLYQKHVSEGGCPRCGGRRIAVAVSITDVLRDGFSMVYTFFDPEQESRGLGHYMILDHIRHAQDMGLPHVYLGYWVKGSPKMDYKRRYKPLEVLDGDQWRTLRDNE